MSRKFEPLRWFLAAALSAALVVGGPLAAHADPSSPSDEPSTSQVDNSKKDDNKTDKDTKKSEPAPAPDPKPEPTKTKEQPKSDPKPDPTPKVDKPKIKTDPVADPVEKPKADDDANKPAPKSSETAKPKADPKPSETAKPSPAPSDPPNPKVTFEQDKPDLSCEYGVRVRERAILTPYVWDGKQWVLGTPLPPGPWSDWAFERDLTPEEAIQTGCLGPKPSKADKVVEGNWSPWSTEQPSCKVPTVTQSRTQKITTTKYTYEAKLVEGDWEWVEKATTSSVPKTENRSVSLTPEQLAECPSNLPKVNVPSVAVTNQVCTVGDQGAAVFTGGSIVVTTPQGVSVSVTGNGGAVSDLTNVAPGAYTVTATRSDDTQWGNTTGWTVTGNTATKTIAVEAAADCTVTQPNPKVTFEQDKPDLSCEYGVRVRERAILTPYVWDGKQWVLGTPLPPGPWSDWAFERDLTPEEAIQTGCLGPKPSKADKVVEGDYEGPNPSCTAPSVKWYRTIYTTKYTYEAALVEGVWGWVEFSKTSEAKDPTPKVVTLSEEELEACQPGESAGAALYYGVEKCEAWVTASYFADTKKDTTFVFTAKIEGYDTYQHTILLAAGDWDVWDYTGFPTGRDIRISVSTNGKVLDSGVIKAPKSCSKPDKPSTPSTPDSKPKPKPSSPTVTPPGVDEDGGDGLRAEASSQPLGWAIGGGVLALIVTGLVLAYGRGHRAS